MGLNRPPIDAARFIGRCLVARKLISGRAGIAASAAGLPEYILNVHRRTCAISDAEFIRRLRAQRALVEISPGGIDARPTALRSSLSRLRAALLPGDARHDGIAQQPVDARLEEYGISIEPEAEAQPERQGAGVRWPLVNRLINGFGMGPALARDLERAGMPMTAAEYAMICIALGTVAFLIGAWRRRIACRTPWAARRACGRRPGRLCAGHLPALPGRGPCQAAGRSAPRGALPCWWARCGQAMGCRRRWRCWRSRCRRPPPWSSAASCGPSAWGCRCRGRWGRWPTGWAAMISTCW